MKPILNFLKSYALTLVLVFSIGTQIVNCNGAATDDIADLIPPTGGGGGGGGGGTGGDTVYGTADDFYIGIVSSTNPIAHVRTAGAFGTKCTIASDEPTSQDLVCIIDSPEGSLYYNGLEMSFNVPEDMCHYLDRTTYWFHNQQTGIGPGNVELYATTITDTNTVTSEVTTTYSYSCTTGNRIGTSVADPDCDSTSLKEMDIVADAGAFSTSRCIYDKSASGGKNCCFGSYRKRTQSFTAVSFDGVVSGTSTPVGSPVTTKQSWGGDYKNCIGGPGKTDWIHYAGDFNFPINRYDDTRRGLLSSYKISSAQSTVKVEEPLSQSTVHIANFYNSVSHTHGPGVSGSASVLPYAINPIDDVTGSQYNSVFPIVDDTGVTLSITGRGNDAYTFSCLDAAYEIKHRIRVYVREWDTYTDYLAYITTEGVTAAPDNKGVAPVVNCEGLPGDCNDYVDIDDLVNTVGTYTATSSTTVRETYFPRIKYKN